jgi:hypothetical protein
MRHVLATTLVLAVATPAAAQPIAEVDARPACGVTFVRAPDDVRYVIEQWIRAEPRCVIGLELRVVPTEGGYYLLARRADGRLHERLVPDAQSAGVLVASWIADDGSPQGAPAVAPTPVPDPITTPAPPPITAPAPMPGSAAPVTAGPYIGPGGVAVVAPRPQAGHRPGRWLTLGVQSTTDGDSGHFFADAELIDIGSWTLTGQIAYGEYHEDVTGAGWDYGSFALDEYSGLVSLARTWRTGRWELTASGGVGLVWEDGKVFGSQSSVTGPSAWMEYTITGMTPFAQISAHVTRRLGDRWGVELGPALTLVKQSFKSSNDGSTLEREPALLMMSGGLRYDL